MVSSLLNTSQLLSKASLILESPKNIVNTLYNSWLHAFNLLHGTPSERQLLLDVIGDKGVELFQLNNILTTFMITQLSGVRDDIVEQIHFKMATLPEFEFNEDGTVVEILVPQLSGDEVVEVVIDNLPSETYNEDVEINFTPTPSPEPVFDEENNV